MESNNCLIAKLRLHKKKKHMKNVHPVEMKSDEPFRYIVQGDRIMGREKPNKNQTKKTDSVQT